MADDKVRIVKSWQRWRTKPID